MKQLKPFLLLKFGLVPLIALHIGCGGSHMPVSVLSNNDGAAPATGGKSEETESQGPFYDTDILPIFKRTCAACHGPGSPKGNWLDYQTAFAKRARIAELVATGAMPMGAPLPADDKQAILSWVREGAPRSRSTVAAPAQPTPVEAPVEPVVVAPEPAPAPEPEPKPVPAPAPPSAPTDPGTEPQPPGGGPTLVTFKDLKTEVFEKHCSLCHNSGANLADWRDFETAYDKRALIYKKVVQEQTMPPAGIPLPPEKREMIRAWIDSGALYDADQAR
ncbi:MAG: cytochrome c [Bdellovibrionaceae bacterium]|nr:cytochrome c [Pseudobdellovibrionaceae bacterium]